LREWTGIEWLDTDNRQNERLTFTVDADSCIGCIGTFKWEWQSRDYGCGYQCGPLCEQCRIDQNVSSSSAELTNTLKTCPPGWRCNVYRYQDYYYLSGDNQKSGLSQYNRIDNSNMSKRLSLASTYE
jgi:hypothetical protein